MTMRYAITHALALAAVLAALAQVSCKDFEFEQVLKTVDWSKPSFVLKLSQKSLSKSWVEDIRSNKGQIPGAVKADIEKQINELHEHDVKALEATAEKINELATRHDEELGKHGERLDKLEETVKENFEGNTEKLAEHEKRLGEHDEKLGEHAAALEANKTTLDDHEQRLYDSPDC